MKGVFFEGLSLTVEDVERSLTFYRDKLQLEVIHAALPAFALVRAGGGTIGLLSISVARKDGAAPTNAAQRRGVHIEFSTDDLDGLYVILQGRGVTFAEPPHDEPWERSMTALDPDGYAVEFAQGRRGTALTRSV